MPIYILLAKVRTLLDWAERTRAKSGVDDTPFAMTTGARAVLIIIAISKNNTHLGVEGAVKGSEDVPSEID